MANAMANSLGSLDAVNSSKSRAISPVSTCPAANPLWRASFPKNVRLVTVPGDFRFGKRRRKFRKCNFACGPMGGNLGNHRVVKR